MSGFLHEKLGQPVWLVVSGGGAHQPLVPLTLLHLLNSWFPTVLFVALTAGLVSVFGLQTLLSDYCAVLLDCQALCQSVVNIFIVDFVTSILSLPVVFLFVFHLRQHFFCGGRLLYLLFWSRFTLSFAALFCITFSLIFVLINCSLKCSFSIQTVVWGLRRKQPFIPRLFLCSYALDRGITGVKSCTEISDGAFWLTREPVQL